MIYLNANRAISTERSSDPDLVPGIFDRLLPDAPLPIIICVVGDRAHIAGAFVSSVIVASGASCGRCRSFGGLDLSEKFCVSPRGASAESVLSVIERLSLSSLELGRAKNAKSNRIFDAIPLDAEELSCLCAIHIFSAERCDFAVLECSERFFEGVLSRSSLNLDAVIFTASDENTVDRLIGLSPLGSREIIRLSSEDCFEHVSSLRSPSGARISTVSPNKINVGRIGALGTDFYYNSDFYQIRCPDRSAVPLASLAVELAFALELCPSPTVNKGLLASAPDGVLELFSVYPLIFINNSDYMPRLDFLRGKSIKFISEGSYDRKNIAPLNADSDALIVQGGRSFTEEVKGDITKLLKNK